MTPRARVSAAAALLLLSGCILPAMGTKQNGRPLGSRDRAAVSKGRVGKAELFDRLGPPMAIAGAGEHVQVPAPTVHHHDEMGRRTVYFGGDSWVQQGDAWLEPFAARRPLKETHRVYYWYATDEGGFTLFLLLYFSTRSTSVAELWVLVDEATGLVEDAVFRER